MCKMGWIERAGAAKDENRELGLGLGFCKGFVGGEMCQNAFISLRFFGPKNFSAFLRILRFSAAFPLRPMIARHVAHLMIEACRFFF